MSPTVSASLRRLAIAALLVSVTTGSLTSCGGKRRPRATGGPGQGVGAAPTALMARAAREAAARNQPVVYQTPEGWRVEMYPRGKTPRGCQQVQERLSLNGRLVSTGLREVC